MKPQEAIGLVKECGLNIEGTLYAECEKAILKSLEKQITQQPIEYAKLRYCCPVCKAILYSNPFYCNHCGQALDWGEEE